MNKNNLFKYLFLSFCLVIVCASCATTHQVRSVETSGFLDNYSQLHEGEGEEALMVYIDPDADFNQYDKIIIDPIRLMASEDSDMGKISEEDRQAIADYFYTALNEDLSKKFTVVSDSGPGTMKLRIALTDMTGSAVVLDTIGSILPIGMALNVISKVATGNNMSVGSATAEVELLDTSTGKRLVAAVDGRGGTKYTGEFDKFDEWEDTKDACDFWSDRIALRLSTLSADGHILINKTD